MCGELVLSLLCLNLCQDKDVLPNSLAVTSHVALVNPVLLRPWHMAHKHWQNASPCRSPPTSFLQDLQLSISISQNQPVVAWPVAPDLSTCPRLLSFCCFWFCLNLPIVLCSCYGVFLFIKINGAFLFIKRSHKFHDQKANKPLTMPVPI